MNSFTVLSSSVKQDITIYILCSRHPISGGINRHEGMTEEVNGLSERQPRKFCGIVLHSFDMTQPGIEPATFQTRNSPNCQVFSSDFKTLVNVSPVLLASLLRAMMF